MAKISLLAFLLFLPLAPVYTAAPEIDVSVGFADRFRSGTISPVGIFISSPDTALNADLILEFTAGTALNEGDRYTFHRALHLSAGIPGLYRFSLPLEVSSYPLSIRLEQQGLAVAEVEKELRPLNVDRPLVVGLSRRPSLDSLIPSLSDRLRRPVELVYPRTEFLPSSSEAWEGVSLVLWHDLSPGTVDSAAMKALELWIEGGGEMIVIGGPWLSGRPFPESLPPGAVGSPVLVDGTAVYLPKEIPSGTDTENLIVYSRGSGRILYVPRDMVSPVIKVNDRQTFWQRTFEELLIREQADTEELESLVAEAWFQDDRPLLESNRFPLILTGLFSCAAGAVLFAGRRIERSGLRILQLGAVLLLSAGTSVVAILHFSPSGHDPVMPPRNMKLLVTGNYGSSRLISRVRFTDPGGGEINWPLPPGGIPVLTGRGNLTVTYEGDLPVLEGLKLRPWEQLELIHSVNIPGFNPEGPESAGESGRIRHNGNGTWFDAVLLSPGEILPLTAEWLPGETLSIPVSAPEEPATGGRNAEENAGPVPSLPEIGFNTDYSRMLTTIVSRGKDFVPFVLARDSNNTIILHSGSTP